jgi:hypothetical protein
MELTKLASLLMTVNGKPLDKDAQALIMLTPMAMVATGMSQTLTSVVIGIRPLMFIFLKQLSLE